MSRIVFIASGSRGDIQPYVALGKGLKDAGHAVRIVTFQNWVRILDCGRECAGSDGGRKNAQGDGRGQPFGFHVANGKRNGAWGDTHG